MPPGRRAASHLFFATLGALALGLAAAGPRALVALAYRRDAILHGDVWRLLTTHLVHMDARHLVWNLGGLTLVWIVFAPSLSGRAWLAISAAAGLAAALGELLLHPDVRAMAGLSAVLHGLMAAGAVVEIRRGRRIAWVFLGVLAVKLAAEQVAPLAGHALGGVPIAADAHAYAALAGALGALLVGVRRR